MKDRLNDDIISSLGGKDTLNPEIWDHPEDTSSSSLKQDVRRKLLKCAYEFIRYIGVDVVADDIFLVGSMVGYNWSSYSDLDIHLMVDFSQFPDGREAYEEMFSMKKYLFTLEHEISIKKYPVECYVHDIEDIGSMNGAYSIFHDKWVELPKKEKVSINKTKLVESIRKWTKEIKEVVENSRSGEGSKEELEDLKRRVFEYRVTDKGGKWEYSTGNLTFKYLRRSGLIDDIFNAEKELVSKDLSMEGNINEQMSSVEMGMWLLKLMNFFGTNKEKVNTKEMTLIKGLAKIIDDGIALSMEPSPMFNESVKTIQEILRELGNGDLEVDGLFGPATRSAVIDFQGKNSISRDGVVGSDTLQMMMRRLKGEKIIQASPMAEVKNTTNTVLSKVLSFFQEKGLTLEQACGIAGNLQAESNFKPNAEGDYMEKHGGYTSYGLAQWHRTRKNELFQFCKSSGKRKDGEDCQLDFMWHELNTGYKRTLEKILASRTPEESAHHFAAGYEKPRSKDYTKRKEYARDIFERSSQSS